MKVYVTVNEQWYTILTDILHSLLQNHSFEDNHVNILAREDTWFERGVKNLSMSNLNDRL